MLWIVAAAASAHVSAQPPARQPAAQLQARASVRIMRAASLDFAAGTAGGIPSTMRTRVRIGEATYPARIIEFE